MPKIRRDVQKKSRADLSTLDAFADKVATARGKVKVSSGEKAELRGAVNRVLANSGALNQDGKFVNPIDRTITRTLTENRDVIQEGISKLAAKAKKPSPLDYYDVYYRVMEDSGLLVNSMPEPATLRRMVSNTGGFTGNFELAAANSCGACGVCGLCSLCSACSACTVSLVVATGATGIVTATIGLAGLFF